MTKRQIRIQLELTKKDQKLLGRPSTYSWDFQELMKMPLSFEVDDSFRNDILRAIESSLNLPSGQLKGYRIVFKDNVLVIS